MNSTYGQSQRDQEVEQQVLQSHDTAAAAAVRQEPEADLEVALEAQCDFMVPAMAATVEPSVFGANDKVTKEVEETADNPATEKEQEHRQIDGPEMPAQDEDHSLIHPVAGGGIDSDVWSVQTSKEPGQHCDPSPSGQVITSEPGQPSNQTGLSMPADEQFPVKLQMMENNIWKTVQTVSVTRNSIWDAQRFIRKYRSKTHGWELRDCNDKPLSESSCVQEVIEDGSLVIRLFPTHGKQFEKAKRVRLETSDDRLQVNDDAASHINLD